VIRNLLRLADKVIATGSFGILLCTLFALMAIAATAQRSFVERHVMNRPDAADIDRAAITRTTAELLARFTFTSSQIAALT
jgi:hypothetical protein